MSIKTRQILDKELQHLQDELLALASMVENAITESVEILRRRDMDGSRRLIAQESRFIRGRAFFKNGERWIDVTVQDRPDAPVKQIKFNSDEYFELLKKHPDMPIWLSIGRNVKLAMPDVVYEITE